LDQSLEWPYVAHNDLAMAAGVRSMGVRNSPGGSSASHKLSKEGCTMIPKKHTAYVFSFFMALLMSSIMSSIISIFNVGLIDGIVVIWLKAWTLAFVIAFPTLTLITPMVRKLVSIVVEDNR
jgi:hypothetical protein